MSPAAIRTHGLTRLFTAGHGVRDLDLHVPEASIYGFLGPNGAGKTTTIRLLLGLLRAQRGDIELLGQKQNGVPLAGVGALVESPSLYAHLSGHDNLEVSRRLLAVPRERIALVLERVDLTAHAQRRVRDYSLGMRQRLGLALALLSAPRVLILDEPSNGLDPAGIQDMRVLLRSLVQADGLTVFVSSHLLGEVELIADHVGVLHQGTLRYQGTLAALRERLQPALCVRCDAPARAIELLARSGCSSQLDEHGDLQVQTAGQQPDSAINRLLVEHGIAVAHLARPPASLEHAFFQLTADAA